MSAISLWFAMGGYAAFVWPAYGFTVFVLGGLAVHSWWRHCQSARLLALLQHASGRGG